MSNNNNLNNLEPNDSLNIKIKISESEEDKDYSQSISLLNNQNSSKPQLTNLQKKYENDISQEYSPKRKIDVDNLSSLQLSKLYRNMKNNENKKIFEKYETKISNLSQNIESLEHEIKLLKREKNSLKDELGFIELEKQKITNTKNLEIELLKEQLNAVEEKYEKEKVKNIGNGQSSTEYNNRMEDYDNVLNKMKKLEEENDYLLNMNNSLNVSMAKLQKENLIINEKYLEMKTNIEELKISNDGYSQNIVFYENKIKEQDSKIFNLETELKQIKLLNKNYEQIIADNDLNLNLSRLNNTSFIVNNRINEEIDNLKAKHEKEISNLKKDYDNILKSKTDDYISDINELKNKISDYELRLKDKENAINLYKSHIDDSNIKTNDQINLLKIELDNKDRELRAKNEEYQKQIMAVIMYKEENEKLNEKMEKLKEDFGLTQTEYIKKIDEISAENSKLKEKIAKYEKIDDDLTKLINDKKNENNLKDEKYFKHLGEKRYNQCLILMKTINIMKIEIEKLKIENEQINNNLKIANDQCNVYKNISEKINQPYSYLIKSLEDKDLELLKLNQIISNKEQSINKLKKECEIYETQINTMKNEIAVIINNRKQIDNLENLLINYINNENEGKNNEKDIDRIGYFLNNFNNNISFNNKDFNKTSSYFNHNKKLNNNNGLMTFPMSVHDNNSVKGMTFNNNFDNKI